jgi:hypothetical protein
MKRSLPWVVITIFLVYVAVAIVRPVPSAGGFDVKRFGRLPVLINGRVQPIDSAARIALLQIRGTVTVPEDGGRAWRVLKPPVRIGATEWLIEALTRPDAADSRRIFRLDDAAVRSTAFQGTATVGVARYYSFKDLHPRIKEIGDEVARVSKVKPADHTATDREWLKLRQALVLYERLKNTLQPNSFLQAEAGGKPVAYDFGAELARYESDMRAAITARREGKTEALDKPTEERVVSFVRPYAAVSRAALLSLVPPSDPQRGRDRWMNTGTALVGSSRTGTFPAPLSFFARMSAAFAQGKADEFSRQLASYEKWLAARGFTSEVRRAATESFYNDFQPLVRALAIYLVALLLAVASMIGRSTTLYRCSAMVLLLAIGLHLTGILFDMMLQGTLPVTNVYSAILCAGGIGVLASAGLERKCRNGVGLIAAAMFGLGALVGAHGIAPGGASGLAAEALDAGFWLAAFVTLLALWFGMRSPRAPVRSSVRARSGKAVRGSLDVVLSAVSTSRTRD